MDQKVTIQRRGGTTNSMNEPTDDWTDLFDTRAAAYPSPGFERTISDQSVATTPITFEVRSEERTNGILPSDRVIWKGQAYNIVAPPMQPERGSNIQITTAADRT
jgi:head-tail adaptor